MSQVRPIEDLFAELIELKSPAEREAYLNKVCSEDQAPRGQLEKLLAAYEKAGSFLAPSDEVATTVDVGGEDLIGKRVGPYTLRERLGSGGMGVVWAAEQKKPLRRKVALKLIKPGMDTEQVIARFDAERAALALMDHPNIARVLDAGTTEQERPYFVMELIRGAPITEYCDAQLLTIHQRLTLFMQVCKAVQHAHQKGIIHRDIKPSNVLVTEQDGEPVPKVIDFGVAKALHQPLTERSLYSGVFQAIGTLAYMSPEQAGLSASDVDTRADIYGLGVLLYELLTGSTPFGKEELASAAFDEACRIIREKEPPKPSTRISTLGERATDTGRNRGVDPQGLGRLVRGDLDWIVSKSLEKDRRRRYETADALAADLQKHLRSEPVDARPPSTVYRMSRFYRRNKAGAQVAIAMTTLLAIGTFALAAALHKAESQRQIAMEQRSLAQQQLLRYFLADAFLDEGGVETVLQRADECALPQDQKALIQTIGHFYQQDLPAAQAALRQAPDGVIKASISAWVETIIGDEAGRYSAAEALEKMVPQDEFEAVMKAQYSCFTRPVQALATMKNMNLAHLRTGTVGHVVHAVALSNLASRQGDSEMMRQAIDEIEAAAVYHPKNRYVACMAIGVFLSASRLALTQEDHEESQRFLGRAVQFRDMAEGTFAEAGLLRTLGQQDEYIDWLQDRMDNNWIGILPLWYAAASAQQGKATQAITFLNDLQENHGVQDSRFIEIAIAQLYATQGNSERVFTAYRKLRSVESDDARTLLLYAVVLLPGIEREKVISCAIELEQGGDPSLIPYRYHLQYWASGGSPEAEERLREESPRRADFEIGVLKYVDGHHHEARAFLNSYLEDHDSWIQGYWARYLIEQISPDNTPIP